MGKNMKKIIKKIPVIGGIARCIYHAWNRPSGSFSGSEKYWADRYNSGGNSGDGSYGKLSEFKAEVINGFLTENNINTVIEYGCGDGNQLLLANYPKYLGFDVSSKALSMCEEKFSTDTTKTFKLLENYTNDRAELTLSLDVIYHLIEDSVFSDYMKRLFDSADRFVIVYASNRDESDRDQAPHVKHRNFTKWVDEMRSDWGLIKHIPNKYTFNSNTGNGSFADFYIYKKL